MPIGTGHLGISSALLGVISRRVRQERCPIHERCGCQNRLLERLEAIESVGVDAPQHIGPQELEGEGELGVDAAAMWRMMTQKLYGSNDLIALATREALQNGADAVRAAYRKKDIPAGSGHFIVRWDAREGVLTFEDNGVGMDLVTLRTKFLVLGATGKSGDPSAAGGFGAAKAVILGVTPTGDWEVQTRDVSARPVIGSLRYTYSTHPVSRQGTRVVLRGIKDSGLYSNLLDQYLTVEERIRRVLALSDAPDMTLFYGEDPVAPLFPRRKGSHLPDFEQLPWGAGTSASVRSYRRAAGTGSGVFYIRLNGLIQFAQTPSYGTKIPSDVVIDLATTARPESNDYPLNASRDRFNTYAPAASAFESLVETFQRESASSGQSPEFDTLIEDSDDPEIRSEAAEFADSMKSIGDDPELKATLDALAGSVADFYREDAVVAARAESGGDAGEAPGAPGSHKADAYDGFRDLSDVVPRSLVDPGGLAKAGAALQGFLAGAGGDSDAVETRLYNAQGALASLEQGISLDAHDARVMLSAIAGVDAATHPAGSVMAAASQERAREIVLAIVDESPKVSPHIREQIKAEARRVNPFGKAAIVKISRKNYDREIPSKRPGRPPRVNRTRSARFLKNAKKWRPYLIAWDLALRLIAREGRVKIKFKPGFVLDDTVRGMTVSEGGAGSGFASYVLIQPEFLEAAVKAHKDRPFAIASYIHHIGAHEITHLPRMGQGHNEAFAVEREDLGVATAHLLPALEQIVVKVFQLEPPMLPAVRAAVREAEQRARDKTKSKFEERARDLKKQARTLSGENARLRAVLEPTIDAVISRLRAVGEYAGFREYVRGAGARLLPIGVTPEKFLAYLDHHPFVAVDPILAWASGATASKAG